MRSYLKEKKKLQLWSRKLRLTAIAIRCADHATTSARKSWPASRSGRSTGVVHLHTKGHGVCLFFNLDKYNIKFKHGLDMCKTLE
jgi:hypothetical protein